MNRNTNIALRQKLDSTSFAGKTFLAIAALLGAFFAALLACSPHDYAAKAVFPSLFMVLLSAVLYVLHFIPFSASAQLPRGGIPATPWRGSCKRAKWSTCVSWPVCSG